MYNECDCGLDVRDKIPRPFEYVSEPLLFSMFLVKQTHLQTSNYFNIARYLYIEMKMIKVPTRQLGIIQNMDNGF